MAMFKDYIRKQLEKRVKQYFAAHPEVKLIVVTGSAGKISAKRAIADVLSQKYRVRMTDGAAYNPEIAMLLGMLGIRYPEKKKSISQWWAVLRAAKKRVKQPTDADIVIQELYTSKPGDMARFATFMLPDIAVVTSITPEHMDVFGTIEAVAQEELSITSYAKHTLINRDDIESRFSQFVLAPHFSTYGTSGIAEYHFEIEDFSPDAGYKGLVVAPEFPDGFASKLHVVGEYSIRPVMAAVASAVKYGMPPEEIAKGVEAIRPAPGRMNLLSGIGNTKIIDDTYNSSPISSRAALQALYSFDSASMRVAVFADMVNLGQMSQVEHAELGRLCDPGELAWVVTVGPESEQYLAPAARARGCQVKSFATAMQAGQFVRSVTEEGAAVLVKGPKDSFYMEEAVKILCNMSADTQLVRQGADWVMRKSAYFETFK